MILSSIENVPEAGIEPARPCGQEILSLSWLPITPLGQMRTGRPGRESNPRIRDLQSLVLPLDDQAL